MAKAVQKRLVNKAAAVREVLASNPEMRTVDVIAELLKRKIKVAPAQISNIKSSLRHPKTFKRKNGKTIVRKGLNGMVSLDGLMAAKKFADSVGGPDSAMELIAGYRTIAM